MMTKREQAVLMYSLLSKDLGMVEDLMKRYNEFNTLKETRAYLKAMRDKNMEVILAD